MTLKSTLTATHRSACSILNVMKIANQNYTLKSQSFDGKPCAVAIND